MNEVPGGLRLRSGLVIQPFVDTCVVVDTASDEVHVLNASAAYVLHCCTGALGELAIATQLADEVGVPLQRAVQDVSICLASFRAKRLLDGS